MASRGQWKSWAGWLNVRDMWITCAYEDPERHFSERFDRLTLDESLD